MKIIIIIVGYNSCQYLEDCLGSLQQAMTPAYSVIFIDNASQDESVTFVRQRYPQTIVIKNTTNVGFAKANNQGIVQARKLKANYVFFLNVDTVIDKDCLRVLEASANSQTILQPLVLLYNTKKS